MSALASFLDPTRTSLKICGVRHAADARMLADLGVEAIGVNFWPRSKRYLDPAEAGWLEQVGGSMLRVGVFVNAAPELPLRLWRDGWIDAIQLHGDESPADAQVFRDAGAPFIKAIGVSHRDSLDDATAYGAAAILMDAHAPGVYGGTGEVFDWRDACDFKLEHPTLPIILAGGITPENVRAAIAQVAPAALDVASGAESAPGVKDAAKVRALLEALR